MLAGVMGLLLVVVPNAQAAHRINASDVIAAAVSQETSTDVSGGFLGGYMRCDPGLRVLTGGAYWHQTGMGGNYEEADNAYLANSAVTKGGKGWYADGHHRFPLVSMDLTLSALCVAKHDLRGSRLAAKTAAVNDSYKADATAKCPQGTEVYTGGAFFHAKGDRPVPDEGGDSTMSASLPLRNGDGWYAAGSGGYGDKSRLTVYARCLAKSVVGRMNLAFNTFTADDDQNAGGTVGCSGDRAPLTGGAYWTRPGQNVFHSNGAGTISSLAITGSPLGLYATGQSAGDGHLLRMVVRCVGPH